jgi:NADH dehydrogenase
MTIPSPSRPRPHIVVVGGGFGGLNATRTLSKGPFDITLVDRDNYHGFWPLLYQVATAGLGPDDIARPIRAIFEDHPNVRVRLGTVSSVDLDNRIVHLDGQESIDYDFLILAAGSATSDFGIPGVDEHAFPLKTLPDAVRLRNHILATFERADADPDLIDAGTLNFVLAGGGPTGVELAGALSELIAHNLARDFHHLDVTRARVEVVEMADHLLTGFSARSQQAAYQTLRRMGVLVRLNATIAKVSEGSVSLADGGVIPTSTVVWTAGVRANPIAERVPTEHGKANTIKVAPDLSVPGHPEVFAIGDLALKTDRHGRPYPMLAQAAIQGGRRAARNILRLHQGKRTKPFRYHNHGIMATVGRKFAVAELPGGLQFQGGLGYLAWLVVHIVFLIGFRNRIVVLINWTWNYISWDRPSRVILDDATHTATGQVRA